jgi:predicted permease
LWVHLRRRPQFDPVVAAALSLSMPTLVLATLVQTLFWLDGGAGDWPSWIGVAACMLVLPFALLARVSRVGRSAKQWRDFWAVSTKGPAR